MYILRNISVFVFCLVFSGCATTGKVLMAPLCFTQLGCGGVDKIEDPAVRISNSCVSVLPPQGEGWTIARKQGWWLSENLDCNPIVFGKGGIDSYETYIAIVAPFKLPEIGTQEEFLEFTRDKYAGVPDIKRYEVVEFEQGSLMSGRDYCSIHSYLVKDMGVSEKYRKGDFMYLELIDINCRHPYDERRAIGVSYSHRYDPGDEDPGFRDQAIEFFGNVEFLE